MKQLVVLVLTCLLLGSSCEKTPKNPVDQLPPMTETGANTFGCLVNGSVFIPGGIFVAGGTLSSNYQLLSDGYHFRLSAVNRNSNDPSILTSVGIFAKGVQLQANITYELDSSFFGSAYARYFGAATQDWIYNTKKPMYSGELKIKRFDTVNQIVSGTFWFDAANEAGQKVEVREGRFDVRFTR